MIREDYVSFEAAKLLKEKGFDEECFSFYKYSETDNCGALYRYDTESYANSAVEHYWDGYNMKAITAPTLSMAIKWLREKYNYHIIVTPEYGDVEYMPGQWQEEFLGWKYTIIPFNGNKSIMYPSVYSITAESAYEAAIKYCLENLI